MATDAMVFAWVLSSHKPKTRENNLKKTYLLHAADPKPVLNIINCII